VRDRQVLQEERERMALDRSIFEERVLEFKKALSKFDAREIQQMRLDLTRLRTQSKEQSYKLKRMGALEEDLNKIQSEHEALQRVVLDKEAQYKELEGCVGRPVPCAAVARVIDRAVTLCSDKRVAQELAESLARKCEALEKDLEKAVANLGEAQKQYKVLSEEFEQVKQSNGKLQKAANDSRKTEQAMRSRLNEMEKELNHFATL
jgi:chromosome segregation ATPase